MNDLIQYRSAPPEVEMPWVSTGMGHGLHNWLAVPRFRYVALPASISGGQGAIPAARLTVSTHIFFLRSIDLNNIDICQNIEEVRTNIDRLDRQIVTLLAERGAYVKQAAKFKKTTADVKAPQRVEQVISKVTALAVELGASSSVTEHVYRAMIAGFINAELAEHAAIQANE